jgi:hypothetical protein
MTVHVRQAGQPGTLSGMCRKPCLRQHMQKDAKGSIYATICTVQVWLTARPGRLLHVVLLCYITPASYA